MAISVEPQRWKRLRDKLKTSGVELREYDGFSMYFRDPDGARLELIAHAPGEM